MRKLLKFLHTLGAIGFAGAIAAQLVLVSIPPEPADLAGYALMREGIAAISKWVLFPSMAAVVVSGLLAMAFNPAYHDVFWAWVKLLFGISVFEGTLVGIHGPVMREAAKAAEALAGKIPVSELGHSMHNESGAMLTIFAVAMLNVVLGVWRPKSLWGRQTSVDPGAELPAPSGDAVPDSTRPPLDTR